MLWVGNNLLSAATELRKVGIDYLYHSIKNPKPDILSKINQLRIVRNLDIKQYSNLKRQLPYVVCGTFNPPFRRTENFAHTDCFIVDIDHIGDKGLDVSTLRKQIQEDERVVMCFLSPSQDGLKVLFKLEERCYDAGIYSLFYKAFVKNFSNIYNLEQVVDDRTSDVCRACFISVDKEAYYNPNAVKVNIKSFIGNIDNADSLFELSHNLNSNNKEQHVEPPVIDNDPDAEVMIKIKALLNPKAIKKAKTDPFVPQQLEEIMDSLKKYVESTGVVLYDICNIHYGKKLRFKMNTKLGEINLFYGKNGFTAVQSPRSGTSADFNKLLKELVDSFIYSNDIYG